MEKSHVTRRGGIAIKAIKCDRCGTMIRHPERYIAESKVEEGKEADDAKMTRYCAQCCLELGYAAHRTEKGEKVLTLLETKE